jgi:hypothetical protein
MLETLGEGGKGKSKDISRKGAKKAKPAMEVFTIDYSPFTLIAFLCAPFCLRVFAATVTPSLFTNDYSLK